MDRKRNVVILIIIALLQALQMQADTALPKVSPTLLMGHSKLVPCLRR